MMLQEYFFGALFALIGVIWVQLNWRLTQIEKMLEQKISHTECTLKRQITNQKIEALERKME